VNPYMQCEPSVAYRLKKWRGGSSREVPSWQEPLAFRVASSGASEVLEMDLLQ
jgi:hypothetical protein